MLPGPAVVPGWEVGQRPSAPRPRRQTAASRAPGHPTATCTPKNIFHVFWTFPQILCGLNLFFFLFCSVQSCCPEESFCGRARHPMMRLRNSSDMLCMNIQCLCSLTLAPGAVGRGVCPATGWPPCLPCGRGAYPAWRPASGGAS